MTKPPAPVKTAAALLGDLAALAHRPLRQNAAARESKAEALTHPVTLPLQLERSHGPRVTADPQSVQKDKVPSATLLVRSVPSLQYKDHQLCHLLRWASS